MEKAFAKTSFGAHRFMYYDILPPLGYDPDAMFRMVPPEFDSKVPLDDLNKAPGSARKDLPSSMVRHLDAARRKLINGEISPAEAKYGAALSKLDGAYRIDRIDGLASSLKDRVLDWMQRMGLSPSPYTPSISWARWDIAKQYYLSKRPEESDPERYHLGNPMEDQRVQDEIAYRHLGWEIHSKWIHDSEQKEIIHRKLSGKPSAEGILEILDMRTKEDGQLPSDQLAKLGRLMVA